MNKNDRIFVAGHKGLVGSAILQRLKSEGYHNIITRSRAELDLTVQADVEEFFRTEKPSYVFLAAARVGGILANDTHPAEFIYENLVIQANVIHSSYRFGAKKLLFLGSSCIYPKYAPQPITEDALLTGVLEPTNEWYAVAKIAGIKMVQAYRKQFAVPYVSIMPTNLYGPGDNFDYATSHVLPALIRKIHQAKINGEEDVIVWGTGNPRREFLHVDDLADASIFAMNHYDSDQILNIGTGTDVSISELANLMKDTVGYTGNLIYDTSKPDGTPRKLLDVSRAADLGWRARISLNEGIRETYKWYLQNIEILRSRS